MNSQIETITSEASWSLYIYLFDSNGEKFKGRIFLKENISFLNDETGKEFQQMNFSEVEGFAVSKSS